MICPRPWEISFFIDGELEPPRRDELAAHLKNCPSCTAVMEDLTYTKQSIETSLHSAETADVPDFVFSRETTGPMRSRRFSSLALISVSLFLLIAGAFLFFPFHDKKRDFYVETQTDVNRHPMVVYARVEGKPADTMIVSDTESKTMFVWAVRIPEKTNSEE